MRGFFSQSGMEIRMLTCGPLATNAFLLTDPASEEALLVDCPAGAQEAVRRYLPEARRVSAVLLTHGHYDHTADLAAIQRSGAKVYAHPDDRELIERPEVMEALMPPGLSVEPAQIDEEVREGAQLSWWGQTVEVRHVPGHCPGNVLFYFSGAKAAFVGDAIFYGSVGRYDLPGGDPDVLERSIRERIYTLPEETTLYPGHGPETSVGAEKRNNPFVRGG